MQWCVYIFLLQEYCKILIPIISNSGILSTQTLGDKHLTNVNTDIFLKTKIVQGVILYADSSYIPIDTVVTPTSYINYCG